MKNEQIKEMSDAELNDRLVEEKIQLSKLNLNHAVSPIENPLKIRDARKTVARLATEVRQRQIKTTVN